MLPDIDCDVGGMADELYSYDEILTARGDLPYPHEEVEYDDNGESLNGVEEVEL